MTNYFKSTEPIADGLGLMHRDRTRFNSHLARDEHCTYAAQQQRQDWPDRGQHHGPPQLRPILRSGRGGGMLRGSWLLHSPPLGCRDRRHPWPARSGLHCGRSQPEARLPVPPQCCRRPLARWGPDPWRSTADAGRCYRSPAGRLDLHAPPAHRRQPGGHPFRHPPGLHRQPEH